MNSIIYLITEGHISVVISLLRKHAKSGVLCLTIMTSLHLPSVVVGYIDSNNTIISKQRIYHREAGLVLEEAEKEMKAIRTIAGQYNEDDIFNMDETGLFWYMPPSRSLSSINRPGIRKDKSWISIICCVNASGTD
jgi:hypothetical protein